MPQGHKKKSKVQIPDSAKQKQKHQKKYLGPKKGGRTILPKKANLVNAGKLQNTLQKAINKRIEKECSQKAHSNGVKPFNVLRVAGAEVKEKK